MVANNTFPSGFPLGRRFGLLMKLYFGALTRKLEQLDIDRHYSILILLENFEGNCSQQMISNLLQIDKASMVRVIDYLVQKGYINRQENLTDRREHRLCLTDKARKILPHIHQGINELNETATEGLSSKQLKDLYESLDILTSNLTAAPANQITVKVTKLKSARK
jgi:DNA-binding MarR family transcriptional regulator